MRHSRSIVTKELHRARSSRHRAFCSYLGFDFATELPSRHHQTAARVNGGLTCAPAECSPTRRQGFPKSRCAISASASPNRWARAIRCPPAALPSSPRGRLRSCSTLWSRPGRSYSLTMKKCCPSGAVSSFPSRRQFPLRSNIRRAGIIVQAAVLERALRPSIWHFRGDTLEFKGRRSAVRFCGHARSL